MKETGRPAVHALGKMRSGDEADSLLGYTDGILRDLKNAEMAISEINC
jgi:hypothetical protein